MRLWLKEAALIAIVASAIGLLDGEMFYLSQIRGSESFNAAGFNQISLLLPPKTNIAAFIGSLNNILSVRIFDLFKEQGLFALYFLALSIGALFYFHTLKRISNHSVLSFVLTLLGLIGLVSSVKDLSISLSFLLSAIELFVLTDARPNVRFLVVPLCLIHFGIDTSYLLPLAFYLLTFFSPLGVFLGGLLMLKSAFVVSEGYVGSPYSSAAAFLLVLLGLVIALRSKSFKLLLFAVLTPITFYLWEETFGQRFPALAFYSPFICAYVWLHADKTSKTKFNDTLVKLGQAFDFKAKNKMAFFFFCLAFIFSQTVTKFFHPLNEAYLPKEALDTLTERRPTNPPLHPLEVGGYVAYRLAPLFPPEKSLNYLDLSAKTVLMDSKVVTSKSYKEIWKGENQALFDQLNAKTVLCQGRDRLCSQLKADDHWKILSHSTLGEKILQKLGNLPVKQREYVSRKLEEESWYLMAAE